VRIVDVILEEECRRCDDPERRGFREEYWWIAVNDDRMSVAQLLARGRVGDVALQFVAGQPPAVGKTLPEHDYVLPSRPPLLSEDPTLGPCGNEALASGQAAAS